MLYWYVHQNMECVTALRFIIVWSIIIQMDLKTATQPNSLLTGMCNKFPAPFILCIVGMVYNYTTNIQVGPLQLLLSIWAVIL